MALKYTKEELAKTGRGELSKEDCARAAYYELMQEVFPLLERFGVHIPDKVANLGNQVGRHSWKTAVAMLQNSPRIVGRVGYDGLEKITQTGVRIAHHCWLTGFSTFQNSPHLIDTLLQYGNHDLVMRVYGLAGRLSRQSSQAAASLLATSADLIDRVGYNGLEVIVDFADKIAPHGSRFPVRVLEQSAGLIDRMLTYGDSTMVMAVYGLCNRMADRCWRTAVRLLERSPDLIDRCGYDGFEESAKRAAELAGSGHGRAISFINGESMEGSLFMDAMTDGLVLEKVRPVLANYLHALLGYRIEIAEGSEHSTDGKRIYLPRKVNDFEDYQANFLIFKVFATHEEAHLEYGSLDFRLSRMQNLVRRIEEKYGRKK